MRSLTISCRISRSHEESHYLMESRGIQYITDRRDCFTPELRDSSRSSNYSSHLSLPPQLYLLSSLSLFLFLFLSLSLSIYLSISLSPSRFISFLSCHSQSLDRPLYELAIIVCTSMIARTHKCIGSQSGADISTTV